MGNEKQTPTPAPAPKKPSRWSRFLDNLSRAIGESLFGGGR